LPRGNKGRPFEKGKSPHPQGRPRRLRPSPTPAHQPLTAEETRARAIRTRARNLARFKKRDKRLQSERKAALRRWKWAVRYPLHLALEKVFRKGKTDGSVRKFLTATPCPVCGGPPAFGTCAVCTPRLTERSFQTAPSRSDAAVWARETGVMTQMPRSVKAEFWGTRRRRGVNQVCLSGIWTVSSNWTRNFPVAFPY